MKRFIAVVTLAFAASMAQAIDTGKAFEDPELQARYEKLIEEVQAREGDASVERMITQMVDQYI